MHVIIQRCGVFDMNVSSHQKLSVTKQYAVDWGPGGRGDTPYSSDIPADSCGHNRSSRVPQLIFDHFVPHLDSYLSLFFGNKRVLSFPWHTVMYWLDLHQYFANSFCSATSFQWLSGFPLGGHCLPCEFHCCLWNPWWNVSSIMIPERHRRIDGQLITVAVNIFIPKFLCDGLILMFHRNHILHLDVQQCCSVQTCITVSLWLKSTLTLAHNVLQTYGR